MNNFTNIYYTDFGILFRPMNHGNQVLRRTPKSSECNVLGNLEFSKHITEGRLNHQHIQILCLPCRIFVLEQKTIMRQKIDHYLIEHKTNTSSKKSLIIISKTYKLVMSNLTFLTETQMHLQRISKKRRFCLKNGD